MARALVLGANGFLGSHVTRALSAVPDLEVVAWGLGVPPAGHEAGWLEIDLLTEADRLDAELRALEPGLIVNCTGATAGSVTDLFELNVMATSNLLSAISRSGIGRPGMGSRLIHIGSAAEYGPGEPGVRVVETACPRPLSPYGIAKLAATQLVVAAVAAGRDATVLRVFNPLGPGMAPGSLPGSAQRRLSDAVAASSTRVEMGPLGSVRDFVDVRDIAAAVVASVLAPAVPPLVNIGSGTGHTARELVEALAARLGFSGETGEAAPGSPRSSDVPWQVADVDLAWRRLGWRPLHGLDSSVDFMVTATTTD